MKQDLNPPLVWIDLEMTGLRLPKDTILEIAILVTDSELNLLATGPNLAIFHPENVLQSMESWSQVHHEKSGLTERCKKSAHRLPQAEEEVLKFLKKENFEKGVSPLCGNSISTDRNFLQEWMPQLANFFHYRNVDISSIKELCARWYPHLEPFRKANAHTALSDIEESIQELKYYKKHLFKDNP